MATKRPCSGWPHSSKPRAPGATASHPWSVAEAPGERAFARGEADYRSEMGGPATTQHTPQQYQPEQDGRAQSDSPTPYNAALPGKHDQRRTRDEQTPVH